MEYDNSYEVLKAAFDAQNGTFNVNPDNEYEVLRAVLDTENECLRVNIDGYITGETGLWEKCIKPATPGVYATYSGTPAGCSTSILVTADVIGIEGNGNFIKGDGVSDIDTNIATWNSSNPTNTISLTSGDGSQIQDNKTTVELSGGVEAIPSPGTFANFSGRPVGCGTPILLTADNKGVNGNSIDLYGNGTTNINDLLSSWNTSNPTNTATLTSGDGTQIPDNKSHTTLSGGRDETTNITTGVQLIEGGSTACGDNAIAGGLNAEASGNNSFAFGKNAIASGDYSISIGYNAETTYDGISIGSWADTETGFSVFGSSIAGITIGKNSTSLLNGIAIGATSQAPANNSIAVGNNSEANGGGSVAIGYGSEANGGSSISFIKGVSNGDYSLAFGGSDRAGSEPKADGFSSIAICYGYDSNVVGSEVSRNYGDYSVMIGGRNQNISVGSDFSGIYAGTLNVISGASNSVILGGENQTLHADNTVMMPEVILSTTGGGIVIQTPDGLNAYKITIDNAGNLVSTLV